MSSYNMVIENIDGIKKEELIELINRTVSGGNIYVNIPNPNGGFPIPIKLKSMSSQFGCLYIDVPKQNNDE